eukprot:3740911-Prymnesium_polylepis.1
MFNDFFHNINLVGGFAGGTQGASWAGRPPDGVPSPPEWQHAATEAGSPQPRQVPRMWLSEALPCAVDEVLQARGRAPRRPRFRRQLRLLTSPQAPQRAWVGGSILTSRTTSRREPRRLTRDVWLQSKAEGRRLVGWTGGEYGEDTLDGGVWHQPQTVVDTSPPSFWAITLVPADSSALLATQEEAARLVACAPSLVQRLPRELLSLIEWHLTDDRKLHGRLPRDEPQSLVRALAVARAAAQKARADVSPPPRLLGFPSGVLDHELHHHIVIVHAADDGARETFVLRLGATIADLVAAIARRTTSKGGSPVSTTVRLMHSGLELTALHPSTRLDRVGRGGDEGVPLLDGAEVWRYEDGGEGGAHLAVAVVARGVGVADTVAEEAWAMRTLLSMSGFPLRCGSPPAEENERAEAVDASEDAVADCEPLCRLRMHGCIEACQDVCYPMRKERMIYSSTFAALGLDDQSDPSKLPAVEAAMEDMARRGREAIEYDKRMGAWARDEMVDSIVPGLSWLSVVVAS